MTMDDSFSTRFGAVTPAANSNPEDRADAGREAITPSLRDGNETPIELQPSLFFNRELSWLEFNQRVLDEAEHADVPLLERLKFLTIASANLDEFFMVRVAGLKRRIAAGVAVPSASGMMPRDLHDAILERTRDLVLWQSAVFADDNVDSSVIYRLKREVLEFRRATLPLAGAARRWAACVGAQRRAASSTLPWKGMSASDVPWAM